MEQDLDKMSITQIKKAFADEKNSKKIYTKRELVKLNEEKYFVKQEGLIKNRLSRLSNKLSQVKYKSDIIDNFKIPNKIKQLKPSFSAPKLSVRTNLYDLYKNNRINHLRNKDPKHANSSLFLTDKIAEIPPNLRENNSKFLSKSRKKDITKINMDFIKQVSFQKKKEKIMIEELKMKDNSYRKLSPIRKIDSSSNRLSPPKEHPIQKSQLRVQTRITSKLSNQHQSSQNIDILAKNLRKRENKNVKKVVPPFNSSTLENEILQELNNLGFNVDKIKQPRRNFRNEKLAQVYKLDESSEQSLKQLKNSKNKYTVEGYQNEIITHVKGKLSERNFNFLARRLKNLRESLEPKALKNKNSYWNETIRKIGAFVPETLIEKMKEMDKK